MGDEHGLVVSVASLRRYVAANLPEEGSLSQVTVLRARLTAMTPGMSSAISDASRIATSAANPVRDYNQKICAY